LIIVKDSGESGRMDRPISRGVKVAFLASLAADHFLQDSYAAGHLINKTLVMQWYVELLAESRIPYRDQNELAGLTVSRQPALHGPEHYRRTAASGAALCRPWDPQRAAEAPTLEERIEASGVTGRRTLSEPEAVSPRMTG
jgi:hypothetical protein